MEHPVTAFEHLGSAVAQVQEGALDTVAPMGPSRRRFLAEVSGRFGAKSRRRWILAFAAVQAAAAVVLVVVLFHDRPLTYAVGDARRSGELGRWIGTPEGESVPVQFSDGSSVVLAPKARARVVNVQASGAWVVIESGRASMLVVPRKSNRWRFNVGPFELLVTGTRFDVAWNPMDQTFSLSLRDGSVLVSGPLVGEKRPVVAGQTMRAAVAESRVEIAGSAATSASAMDSTSAPPVSSLSVASSDGLPDSSANVATPTPRPSAPGVLSPSWQELTKAGKYREAMDAVESTGFESACQAASAPDLLQLAEAARLSGSPRRASQAYQILRSRFPSRGESALAAFALGKIAFDQQGAYGEAARWFSTFVQEQPNGVLAREAAGRLIEARQRSGDGAGARAAAELYLTRYPDGPHANLARRTVGEPQRDGGR